ncbi:MAG: DsbA family protein [Anaerolineae bacterium]|nr:DsbA family protein [Anaerolineae bacterium]
MSAIETPKTHDEIDPRAGDPGENEAVNPNPAAKRSLLKLFWVPLVFAFGLAAGYWIWGRPAPQTVQRFDIPITANDPVFGPDNAPITLIEFSDFECPYCRSYFLQVLPRIKQAYPGQIRYVYKDFPLTSIHANAVPAAQAALCAHEQNAFWEFHDLLFTMQIKLGRAAYEQYAADLQLNTGLFTQCLDAGRYVDQIQADYEFAARLGIRSTPTFFINGIPLVGAQPFENFAAVIDRELKSQR